jgi:hypothetical protein
MPRFVVDLGNVKLSEEEHSAIAGAIHSAVMSHLSKVSDPGAHHGTKTLTRAGMGFAPPPDSPKPPKATKATKSTTAAKPAAADKPAKPAKPAKSAKPAKPAKSKTP